MAGDGLSASADCPTTGFLTGRLPRPGRDETPALDARSRYSGDGRTSHGHSLLNQGLERGSDDEELARAEGAHLERALEYLSSHA